MQLFVALAITLLVGCSSRSTIDGPIDYECTGGYAGGGDGTHLHVERDGSTTRSVRLQGSRHWKLEPDALARLQRAVYRADLPNLDGTYFVHCRDCFIYRISVQLDGVVRTVSIAEGERDVPPELSALLDLVRSIS